ncbi:MAG: substrate-binding domain-containing protein, partial [Nocardioidaceae bacterium]
PIPRSLAIVGFDDSAVARLASPALTTVAQPIREMGNEAARIAIGIAMRAAPGAEPAARDQRVLPTRMVIRESCGCGRGPAQRE